MLRRIVTYSMISVLVLFAAVLLVGLAVRKRNVGRIAPGVTLCGQDVSGMRMDEVAGLLDEMLPETVTEVRCRFLPEMREEIEEWVRENTEEAGKEGKAGGEKPGALCSEQGDKGVRNVRLTVQENEVCLTARGPMFQVDAEKTLQTVADKSGEVKVWEWLYAAVTGRPYRERQVEVSLLREEERFGEYIDMLCRVTERERQDATVAWKDGKIKVTESRRGFRP